jgi:hypothetical protein
MSDRASGHFADLREYWNRHEAAKDSFEHSIDINVGTEIDSCDSCSNGVTALTLATEPPNRRADAQRDNANRDIPNQVSHVHHSSVAGSMTAPITTTSFGSPSHSPQSLESNPRSPLKRTHSEHHSSEDHSLEEGQRGRPIKKIKQGGPEEGQEPDGFVARLFKYAWQIIGPTTEGS